MGTRSVRLVLAIDNAAFRSAVAEFIQACPGLSLVGQFGTCRETLMDTVSARTPDLVLTDWPLNGGLFTARTVLELSVRRIREVCPRTRVVLIASEASSDYRAAARAAGVDGVVSRGEIAVRLLLLIDELFRPSPPQPVTRNRQPLSVTYVIGRNHAGRPELRNRPRR